MENCIDCGERVSSFQSYAVEGGFVCADCSNQRQTKGGQKERIIKAEKEKVRHDPKKAHTEPREQKSKPNLTLIRPTSVTILGWGWIIFGIFNGILFFAMVANNPEEALNRFLDEGYGRIFLYCLYLLACGVGILRGKGWARNLFLIGTPCLIIILLMTGKTEAETGRAIIGIPVYLIWVFFFTRPKASAYFKGEGVNLKSLIASNPHRFKTSTTNDPYEVKSLTAKDLYNEAFFLFEAKKYGEMQQVCEKLFSNYPKSKETKWAIKNFKLQSKHTK